MGGRVCLRCKCKTLLGFVKKFIDITQQCFAPLPQVKYPTNNLNFHWRWWDWIQAIFLNFFCFKNAKTLPGQWSSDLNLQDFDDQQYQNYHVKYHRLAIGNKQQTHYGPIFLLKSDSIIWLRFESWVRLRQRLLLWALFSKLSKFNIQPGSVGNLVKKFFQSSECSLLGRKSNPQFLKIWFFDHFWQILTTVLLKMLKNWEIQPLGILIVVF